MFEYLVINIDEFGSDELEKTLNFYSKDGWRVLCDTLHGIVMEREMRTELPTATYSFIAHSKSIPSSAEE